MSASLFQVNSQDFFQRKFYSYQEFKDAQTVWQDKFFQLLSVRNSVKLDSSDSLSSKYIYNKIVFSYKHPLKKSGYISST